MTDMTTTTDNTFTCLLGYLERVTPQITWPTSEIGALIASVLDWRQWSVDWFLQGWRKFWVARK